MVSRPCVHALNMFECRYMAEDGRPPYVHKMHEKRINTHFQVGGKKDKSYFELMHDDGDFSINRDWGCQELLLVRARPGSAARGTEALRAGAGWRPASARVVGGGLMLN